MENEEKELSFKNIRYQPLQNIKTEGQIDRVILFKPVLAPFVCLAAGIGLLALIFAFKIKEVAALLVLGMFFIIYALSTIFFVKDRKVCDIYTKGVLFYNPKDSNYAWYLDYKFVKEWTVYHMQGHDIISFTLTDLNKVGFDTFQANKAYKTLYKYIGDKEEKTIRAKESAKKPLQIHNWIKDKIDSYKK